ncbi:MAG: hypothetical protein AAGF77_04690 [Bacteroidota bacterium]
MSSRSKLIGVALAIVVALLLCYQLALSKTFALYKEYQTLQKETALSLRIPKELQLLAGKEQSLDATLKEMNLGDTSVENNLLGAITRGAAEGTVRIVDFQETHSVTTNDLTIDTYRFSLEGSFNDILKVVHGLELQGSFGKVVHADFVKNKKTRRKKEHLVATLFFQQLN